MDQDASLYGLIGWPLTHSFSQTYFNQKFQSEGIDARYINFEIPEIGDFMKVIAEYPQLRGLNVTIPYKEQVIRYLDEIDTDAARIGAVNVIKFTGTPDRPRFKGFNSDVIGFSDSLRPLLNAERTNALILGTGGAAKAVACGLENMGVKWQMVSRTPRPGMLGYDNLTPEVIRRNKIIINTTPLGMYPHVEECPDIPYHLLTPAHLCYDLLYNPDVTLFMRRAEAMGAEVKNGLEMLLLQAFVSWNIWNA